VYLFLEPLVAVDKDTDRLIQQTITENFQHETVIILASRFNLIMEADRIMVMDRGRIIELDTPLNLITDPRSKFMKMVNNSSDVDVAKLRKIAERKVKQGVRPHFPHSSSSSAAPATHQQRWKRSSMSKVGFLHSLSDDNESVSSKSSGGSTSNLSTSMPKSLENLFVGDPVNPALKKRE
jgi:ABC-type proline/glycine betaine transport system ATPase subunit